MPPLTIHPPRIEGEGGMVVADVTRTDGRPWDRLRVRMSGVSVADRYEDCGVKEKHCVGGFADAAAPWMLEVREAEREVCRRLRAWATLHGLPVWRNCLRVGHTMRKCHGLAFFAFRNNPDEEKGGEEELKYRVGCRCDLLVELLEIRRAGRGLCYKLIWRVVSGEVTAAAQAGQRLRDSACGGDGEDLECPPTPGMPALTIHPPRTVGDLIAAGVTVISTAEPPRIHMTGVSVGDRDWRLTSLVFDASAPWVRQVREAEREVQRRMRDWAELHGLVEGADMRVRPRVSEVDGIGFMVVFNNPDEGGHNDYGTGCMCDMTVELFEIRKAADSSSEWIMVGRVVSAKVTRDVRPGEGETDYEYE